MFNVRHIVEMVLCDRLLSKYPPSQVALAIFDTTKVSAVKF